MNSLLKFYAFLCVSFCEAIHDLDFENSCLRSELMAERGRNFDILDDVDDIITPTAVLPSANLEVEVKINTIYNDIPVLSKIMYICIPCTVLLIGILLMIE
ncbi:putative SP-containing membrane protein [Vairimorpha necatrix]|uniref:SP-containing membrane protein n=1 Tax=Vairimorpha necatrix TaxID=6039 RepID=A0AAX4JF10_9MICR